MHIAQADGVTGLAAVETTFFGQDNAIVEAERIDNGGPHAA